MKRARSHRPSRLVWPLAGLAILGGLAAVVGGLAPGGWITAWRAEDRLPPALTVAIVAAEEGGTDLFLEGARLAIEDVNAQGGVGGLPLRPRLYPDVPYRADAKLEEVVVESLALAERVSRTPDLLGVIGHFSSATAVPASAVYNNRGVLFLGSHATASSLTNHAFPTVFGLQPNNKDNAGVMAHYGVDQLKRRYVVLGDDSDYGREVTGEFIASATQLGAEILYNGSLTGNGRSIDRLILFLLNNATFNKGQVDAFFVASASSEDTATFIRRARRLGFDVPILGPEYIFSNYLVDLTGKEAMRDVCGVSLYDVNGISEAGRRFIVHFSQANKGVMPDLMAAIGYDAIGLLVRAYQDTGRLDPLAMADALRVMRYDRPFEGVTGALVFDINGLVTDTDMFVVCHDGTRFQTRARYHKPLEWDAIALPHNAMEQP